MTSDQQERARVRSRIGSLIMEFCRENYIFHMKDLTLYVQARVEVAPDSPGRILRDLKRRGFLHYKVICREKSLYQVKPPGGRGKRHAEQIPMFARAS